VAKPQDPETPGEADNTNVGQMWSAGCGGFFSLNSFVFFLDPVGSLVSTLLVVGRWSLVTLFLNV